MDFEVRALIDEIEWGRHGEVFEYDFHAGSIDPPERAQAADGPSPGDEWPRRICPRFVTTR